LGAAEGAQAAERRYSRRHTHGVGEIRNAGTAEGILKGDAVMTSWNERRQTSRNSRMEPRQIAWRLFALEVLLVLAVITAVLAVAALR